VKPGSSKCLTIPISTHRSRVHHGIPASIPNKASAKVGLAFKTNDLSKHLQGINLCESHVQCIRTLKRLHHAFLSLDIASGGARLVITSSRVRHEILHWYLERGRIRRGQTNNVHIDLPQFKARSGVTPSLYLVSDTAAPQSGISYSTHPATSKFSDRNQYETQTRQRIASYQVSFIEAKVLALRFC